MIKHNAAVLPDEFRDDSKLSPDELEIKYSIINQAKELGVSWCYKSDYVSREKHLETVFKQLLFKHFNSRDLWWNYSDLDDDCLRRLDKDLYIQIAGLFPDLLELMGDYQ